MLKEIKQYADPNCEDCNGEGEYEVDVNNQPYGTGVHQEKRTCHCVAEALEEEKFSVSK